MLILVHRYRLAGPSRRPPPRRHHLGQCLYASHSPTRITTSASTVIGYLYRHPGDPAVTADHHARDQSTGAKRPCLVTYVLDLTPLGMTAEGEDYVSQDTIFFPFCDLYYPFPAIKGRTGTPLTNSNDQTSSPSSSSSPGPP